jgi:antitoxin HicB
MKNAQMTYPFEILPLSKDEGGGYAITFPDLAGCRSDGATPEQAIENGRLALADWLAVAVEFDDAIPVPFSSVSGRFVQRVPKSLHRQLVDEAKNEGVSLNTLVVSLVAEGIGRRAMKPNLASRSSGRATKTRRTA